MTSETEDSQRLVIMVHGGAYTIPDFLVDGAKKGTKEAAIAGWRVLQEGGTALDAVEAAVVTMENIPQFNSGTGSSLTIDSTVEMDALVMDGQGLKVGAVACVDCVRNPVKLARAVLEKTDHCLFVGEGSGQLARNLGFDIVSPTSLPKEESFRRLEEFKTFNATVNKGHAKRSEKNSDEHDTVGAVALDRYGHIAAATSTGGITGKMIGRIGDSPLAGSGGWADDLGGAVSTTGHGEAILRVCLAHRCTQLMMDGATPQTAAEQSIKYLGDRVNGAAGLICINPAGSVGLHFNTERMVWAYIKDNSVHQGVLPGEHTVTPLIQN